MTTIQELEELGHKRNGNIIDGCNIVYQNVFSGETPNSRMLAAAIRSVAYFARTCVERGEPIPDEFKDYAQLLGTLSCVLRA